ncbi:MAG: DUF3667 domain-containing protein [Planctomycetota bacterium]
MSSGTATPTEPCLNCGAVVTGRYCSACGQREGLSPKSIRSAFTEVLGNVFSYDNKLWRSLVLLLVKPGYLTKAFVEGKRSSFIHPLRMFLFLGVAVFFAPDTWNLEETPLPEAWTQPAEGGASFVDRFQIGIERVKGWKEAISQEEMSNLMLLALADSILLAMAGGILVMSLVMRILHWRSYLVEHLVFGLHFASFICLSNLILRLVFQDIGNTMAEQLVMGPLMIYWMVVGYQVCYGRPGWWRRIFAFLASAIAFGLFQALYIGVIQATVILRLMPPAS